MMQFDNKRPIDLICMGRVAVDLYAEQIGVNLADATSFNKYLGGCAGNIAVGTARLGLQTMMLSCVGQDEMGTFLIQELQRCKVNTDLVRVSDKHLTGLVLLGIKPPHEFPLIFYRNDCADMQIKSEQIKSAQLRQAKALLITGTGLSTASMLKTTKEVVAMARSCETAVIMDLDFRPVLWGLTAVGNGEARYLADERVSQTYQELLSACDLIVGTEEEVCIAGGHNHFEKALAVIQELTKAPLVVKFGDKGCKVYFSKDKQVLKSKPFKVEVLNVLGAGDAFMSGLLLGLLREQGWDKACTYANAAGAIVVTKHGCAPAMPDFPELVRFIDGAKDCTQLANHDGLILSTLKLAKGQNYQFPGHYETAALLLTGKVTFHYAQESKTVERYDYFTQNPYVLHTPSGIKPSIHALTDCELLIMETDNNADFPPMLFDETNLLELDHRGQGLLENTSYRIVRTVFDKRNRPQSNLVVGEIITFQGRWSSYPSHYHDHPEIYHYRFSEPQGYAFGEKGTDVLRIKHNDTYCIPSKVDHAHATAPGYALYTLWFIKHLANNPYIKPTFRNEHEWTRHECANQRTWNLV